MRTLASVILAGLVTCAAPLACSSNQGSGGGSSTGSGVPASITGGSDVSPDGAPYPTRGLGHRARGLDAAGKPSKTPGTVVPNLKFMGYPDGDSSGALQPVSLADLYDPTGKHHALIHVIYSDAWCPDCQSEIGALVASLNDPASDYRKHGVVYLEAIGEGVTPNVAATQRDLDFWIDSHPRLLAEVLDPEARSLGAFFDATSVPYNADIDARSMELLSAATGYSDPAAVQAWVDWVSATPAATF